MTETMSPTSSLIGKHKRCDVEEVENRHNSSFMVQQNHNSCDNFMSYGPSIQKRGRADVENMNPFGALPQQTINKIEFRTIPNATSNSSNMSTNFGGQALQSTQLQNYHESLMTSLKMEHQMNLEKKNQEINQIKALNNALIHSLDTTKKEHHIAMEENKLPKKAVAIQDGRNRELNTQNHELQNVLQLASQHIARLEENNRRLQSQLLFSGQYNSNNSAHDFDRPPDLY